MFESAAQEHVLDKEAYEQEEPTLHESLVQAQLQLVREARFPVIILVSGVDGAGKGEAINRLYGWLDPRHIRTCAYEDPTDEERLRPRMWRYWRDLPPKGAIGVVVGSWYNDCLRERVLGALDEDGFERQLNEINRFEEMLTNEGALLLKLWFHLSPEQQAKRLKKLRGRSGAVRHVLNEWSGLRQHRGAALHAASEMARITSTGHAPWIVVPSGDVRYRDIAMGRSVFQALSRRLGAPQADPRPAAPAMVPSLDRRTVLDALDLSRTLPRKAYRTELAAWQDRLAGLVDHKSFRRIALVAAFEGTDAAGKGGAIRRATAALDPRRFQVHPIAAPSDEELAQPYLWRFWRRLPRRGHVAVFDRTWYGRVLVERVEGLCTEAEWLRAYNEINDFEEQLIESDVVLVKFWLAISKDEQLRRFKAREATPFKQYKITPDDWRNREKWDAYRIAVSDMVDRTSTERAPWTLVEAEDKNFSRVKILRTLCERIEGAIG
jgi:polyphosphate:AMP phosphotransferase